MTEKVWNVAAYCRLSRDDGDKAESNSIGSQRDIIREFLRDRTDMVIVKEYVDDGYSGVNFDRPGFKQMMEDIRQKKINFLRMIQTFHALDFLDVPQDVGQSAGMVAVAVGDKDFVYQRGVNIVQKSRA